MSLNFPLFITVIINIVLAQSAFAAEQTITDARNKKITINTPVQRIAALIPALAELVEALDKNSKLVAHPEYSNISNKKSVSLGPYTQISAEAVYAVKPQIVLASIDGNEPNLVSTLERLGLPVVVVDTRSIAGLKQSFSLVAQVLGIRKEPHILTELNKEIKQLTDIAQARKKKGLASKVFLQLGWNPLVSVSKNSFIGELLELAGLVNIFANSPFTYPKPSTEAVIAANPDIIFICPLTNEAKEGKSAKDIWTNYPDVNAIKNKHMYLLPINSLTKPGPTLVDGIRAIRKALQ